VVHFSSLSVFQAYIALMEGLINTLKTKRRPLYLKTQSLQSSKHFSSRL